MGMDERQYSGFTYAAAPATDSENSGGPIGRNDALGEISYFWVPWSEPRFFEGDECQIAPGAEVVEVPKNLRSAVGGDVGKRPCRDDDRHDLFRNCGHGAGEFGDRVAAVNRWRSGSDEFDRGGESLGSVRNAWP
jgi:hypothetical protein